MKVQIAQKAPEPEAAAYGFPRSLQESPGWRPGAAQPPFADGTEQNVEWNQLLQLPLGFPRGEAAERSEADEGWRQVGQ